MAKVNRRFVLSAMSGAVAFTALTGSAAAFGLKIPGLGGGGGGGSWTGIVKGWKSGLSILVKAAVKLGEAQADLADALGLKQQAALLRGQVESLKKGGDTVSGSQLEEAGTISASVQTDINKRIKKTGKLSVKEKAAIGKAGVKIAPAMIKIAKGVFKLVKASQAASKAGAPSPSDIAAIPIAAEIPVLIPAAIGVIPKMFDVASDFRKIANEKDIAVPEIPAAPSFS